MPTIFRVGPYRFYFYASDGAEPPHVHVQCGEQVAKVWLDPIRLHDTGGLRRADVNRIMALIAAHRDTLLESWHEFFEG